MYEEIEHDTKNKKIDDNASVEELLRAINLAEEVATKRSDLVEVYRITKNNVFFKAFLFLFLSIVGYYAIGQITFKHDVIVVFQLMFLVLFIFFGVFDFYKSTTRLNTIRREIQLENQVLDRLHTLIDEYRIYLGERITFINKALIEMKLSRISFDTDYK